MTFNKVFISIFLFFKLSNSIIFVAIASGLKSWIGEGDGGLMEGWLGWKVGLKEQLQT